MEHMVDGPGDESREADALSAAMHAVGGDVTPATAQLVRGGLARGRRMRRMRQLQIVGAAAAVAVVGGGIAVAAQGGSSGATSAGPAAHGVQSAPAPGPATTPMPSNDLVMSTFQSLLPQGWAVSNPATGNDKDKSGNSLSVDGTLLLDDGHGAASVNIALSSKNEAAEHRITACPDLSWTTAATCADSTLADGSKLQVETNREYPVSQTTADGKAGPLGSGAKLWSVTLVRPDGSSVFAQSSDTAGEKTGDVTRSVPVLSLDQLTQIVEAPVWAQVLPLGQDVAVLQGTAKPSADPSNRVDLVTGTAVPAKS